MNSPPYHFSPVSLARLAQCHKDLQLIFTLTIAHIDCTILAGWRDEETQNRLAQQGLSRLTFPHSRHNCRPSMAVDVAPYHADIKGGIDWEDSASFALLAGFVLGLAQALRAQNRISHRLIWGGDWNNNGVIKDENFRDLVHFELRPV